MQRSKPSTATSGAEPENVFIFFRLFQFIFYFIGVTILLFLFFRPDTGLMLFWNVLIPIAPALMVVATGVWRSVCPLATTSLLPYRLRLSKAVKLNDLQRSRLNLIALLLLFGIIPIRHLVFNSNGQATGILLILIAIASVAAGFVYERKSGWCAGLCPVHPVEALYGTAPAFSVPNLNCSTCVRCSRPCPDSVPFRSPGRQRLTLSRFNELTVAGVFPGFIWGWFHVPDFSGGNAWLHLSLAYLYPMLSGLFTLALFLFVLRFWPRIDNGVTIRLFAFAAVSCYYWYRLPMLFGFNPADSNGILVDLSRQLPGWTPIVLRTISTGFFLYWIIVRKKRSLAWSPRPPYA